MRWNVDLSPLNDLLVRHMRSAQVYQEILAKFRESSETVEYYALQRVHRNCAQRLLAMIKNFKKDFQMPTHIALVSDEHLRAVTHPLDFCLIDRLFDDLKSVIALHNTALSDVRLAPEWREVIEDDLLPMLDEARQYLFTLSPTLAGAREHQELEANHSNREQISELLSNMKAQPKRRQKETPKVELADNHQRPRETNEAFVLPRSQVMPAFG